MVVAGVVISVVSALFAGVSAWIALRQYRLAKQEASRSEAAAETAQAAATRAAAAQERLADAAEAERDAALSEQARCVTVSFHGWGGFGVVVENGSTNVITDVELVTLRGRRGGEEWDIEWSPNYRVGGWSHPLPRVNGDDKGTIFTDLSPLDMQGWELAVDVHFTDANGTRWSVGPGRVATRVER